MATVKSIFNIRGGLGDYVFYTLNGKQVARRKPAKKRDRKSETYAKVQVLNSEFAHVASCSKLIREALQPECAQLNNPALHSALMKTLLTIKNNDAAEKGFRTVVGGLSAEASCKIFREFRFQKHRKARPMLVSAKRKGSDIQLDFSRTVSEKTSLIELQLNFETGKFRRAEHAVEQPAGKNSMVLKRSLRSKKGFREFWFLSGEDFMNGAVIISK